MEQMEQRRESYNYYTGLLRMMDQFQPGDGMISVRYSMEYLEDLRNQYHLSEIAGTGGDFERIAALLAWESEHITHVGDYDGHVRNTAMDLFAYAFDNKEAGINCRSLSMALAECYLSIGIKARSLFLMPLSPYDFDCHVVCEAWSEQLVKWVMVDPTNACYTMGEDGVPLSALELRERLAQQGSVTFNPSCHYNGEPVDPDDLLAYYAKNLFSFEIYPVQGYHAEQASQGKLISIAPIGCDVKKRSLLNTDYRIKHFGVTPWLQKRKLLEQNQEPVYQGPEILR